MCSSADASLPPSQATAHGSRSMWIATPSSYRTCTDYSLPVSRRTAKDSVRHLEGRARSIEAIDCQGVNNSRRTRQRVIRLPCSGARSAPRVILRGLLRADLGWLELHWRDSDATSMVPIRSRHVFSE
jgi:hypothetical protein